MGSFVRSLAAVVLSLQLVSAASAPPPPPPVCIIGAGPAGLTAASVLESKGYKTVLFDKQAEIGGKCQSYYDDKDTFLPWGAAFFSNGSYAETLKVVNAAGVPASPITLGPGQKGRVEYEFDYKTGATSPAANITAAFAQAVAAEIPRYAALWQSVFAPVSVANFKNGVPSDLTVPALEWFHKNNFTALPILAVKSVALYGYGDISVVPILYILQYLTPDMVLTFVGRQNAYLIDFHKMWVKWARTAIKGPIHTNAQVTHIDRSLASPILRYNGKRTQKCASLVLAFPPTIENLKNAGLDITARERAVFSSVGVHNYFTTIADFNLPYGVSYVAKSRDALPTSPPPSDGEPVAMLRLHKDSDVVVAWSWGPYAKPMTEAYARSLSVSTLAKINKDPRNATAVSLPFTDAHVKVFKKWDYFPHFDSAPLAAGAYTKLNQLQGSGKTYWASGLAGFENVEWAIRGGKDVAESYF